MSGRRWAYLGALLGGVVSVLANVAHSYVPPAAAAPGWRPPVGAVVGAVFWPLALFVAIEVLARVVWPAGRRWVLLRFGGLLPVALVAAVVSYRHLSGLLAWYGEDRLTVTIGPLAVDGLMVVATAALVATSRPRTAEVPAVVVPPAAPVPVLVEPGPPAEPLPEAAPTAGVDTPRSATPDPLPAAKPASRRPASTPRRAAETTRRMCAALDADGMNTSEIAAAVGITERAVRAALRPATTQRQEDDHAGRA